MFVFSISARAARTVFCSFFVRSLFVLCSSFVRLLFVNYLSARVAHTICLSCYDCPCGSHQPVWLALSLVTDLVFLALLALLVLN
ncbi:hypothetical protein HMPREF9072_00579 [Capnocytophaga sp. oral taxon 324 str. F0483]|nr:hypothetical protein HMPREF9072_00579 [Capnocytophaga sp. oral taxon 324 str. F0483]